MIVRAVTKQYYNVEVSVEDFLAYLRDLGEEIFNWNQDHINDALLDYIQNCLQDGTAKFSHSDWDVDCNFDYSVKERYNEIKKQHENLGTNCK